MQDISKHYLPPIRLLLKENGGGSFLSEESDGFNAHAITNEMEKKPLTIM